MFERIPFKPGKCQTISQVQLYIKYIQNLIQVLIIQLYFLEQTATEGTNHDRAFHGNNKINAYDWEEITLLKL